MGYSLGSYIPVLVLLFTAIGIGAFIITSSYIMSPRFKSKAKDVPYESGFLPVREAKDRFNIRFCVIAILFIIFDVEAAFIFPWAIFYKKAILSFSPVLILGEMFLFLGILIFGLAYVWARGGLDWE